MGDWQPIETAEMDTQTPVLLWDGLGVVCGVYYRPDTIDEWWESVGDDSAPDRDGYDDYLSTAGEAGWMSKCLITGDEEWLEPTHWMPLPAPPETALILG